MPPPCLSGGYSQERVLQGVKLECHLDHLLLSLNYFSEFLCGGVVIKFIQNEELLIWLNGIMNEGVIFMKNQALWIFFLIVTSYKISSKLVTDSQGKL